MAAITLSARTILAIATGQWSSSRTIMRVLGIPTRAPCTARAAAEAARRLRARRDARVRMRQPECFYSHSGALKAETLEAAREAVAEIAEEAAESEAEYEDEAMERAANEYLEFVSAFEPDEPVVPYQGDEFYAADDEGGS